MKRPSFQFYPGDWLRSTDLRSCSIAARGLWIEILALMHEGEPYGHLRVGKKPIDPITLARMVGSSREDVDKCLAELEQAQVFSRTASGIIYSRRMVRDENKRNMCASEGAKSLAHPNVTKPRYPSHHPTPHPTPPSLPPSAASAVASASAIQKLFPKPGNGKKDPRLCHSADCNQPGTRSRSTNGGPFYCNEHYDGHTDGTKHITEHISLPAPNPSAEPKTQSKGKFED
jgi:hypothetical protein